MNKFDVSISPIPLDHKPPKSEIPNIQSKFVYSGMTYNQLIEYTVLPYSYTIAPAVFANDNREKKSWKSQQVYMLDFDGAISIDAVLARFKEYDIIPNFYYTTFRHTDNAPRFRVVLLTDFSNNSEEDGNKIRGGLKKSFPEADPTCFTAERMFYGGKKCFPLNEEPIPFAKLEQMISIHVLEADNGKSRGLMSQDGYLYNNIHKDTHFEPDGYEAYLDYLKTLGDNTFDFGKIYEKVELFRCFIDGDWLYHNQLLGIATNLKWLKGGAKLFNDTMRKHNEAGKTTYAPEKFKIMTYLNKRTYLPMRLQNFSPYEDDWQYENLITAVRFQKGSIEVIRNQELISLDEANMIFNRETERVFNSKDPKIYIFKVPTGFGKTTFLSSLPGQFIAFPTHRLKEEKSVIMQVEHVVIPELPTFMNREINTKIKGYYKMGLNEAVRKVLMAVAIGKDNVKITADDQCKAREYLNKINAKPSKDVTVLTTHQRAILGDTSSNPIIFDEDPINDVLSIDAINISDLTLFNANLPKPYRFDNALQRILSAEPGIVVSTNIPAIPRDTICDTLSTLHVKTNVVKFLGSMAFIRVANQDKISFIAHRELPGNKKIIIMSATAQTHLYQLLYPGRVEVIDISNVEQVGKVYQHTSFSCSRYSLDESRIIDILDDMAHIPVITFKSKKAYFNHHSHDMHFGNLQGYDELKGSDIAVIGTPHYNDIVYRLMAFAVGINPNGEGDLKNRIVNYGNYRFRFKTFKEPELQKIQLGLIEAELIQAVGRARTLREDCVVELYSNLPIANSVLSIAA